MQNNSIEQIQKATMTKTKETIKTFFEILETFPSSYNGQKYLTLTNNRKLFFNLFIKKYGLNGEETKYKNTDILRRIRMIEFFDYITKEFDLFLDSNGRYIIETNFFRMVIIETKKKKLELLSFYNFR